jgi:hypothetical protein
LKGTDGGDIDVGTRHAYGQNWTNANWSGSVVSAATSSAASLDGTDDTNDAITWMAELVLGFKPTTNLRFEVGAGYRNDDPDSPGSDNDEVWAIYGQAAVTLAPGVNIIPEVGYYDKMDNAAGNDEGHQWYAGAKWQIDF